MPPRPKWPLFALVFAALGAVGSALYRAYVGPAPHYVAYLLIVGFSAWLGALLGAAFDWLTHRISPLEPLFASSFARYYRLGIWLRFAIVFAGGWLVSALLALIYVAIWGDTGEFLAFVSPGGLISIAILTLIYAFIGAVTGGLLSAALHIFGKGSGTD